MQKVIQVMKKEEIPQIMLIVFLFAALVSFGAALLAPIQLTKDQATQYYARDSNLVELISAIVMPIVITLLVGICLLLWKLKWPSREG